MHRHYSTWAMRQPLSRVYTKRMVPLELTAFALTMPTVLWALFGLAFATVAVISGVTVWHWHIYSTGKYTTSVTLALYLSVNAGLLLLMALSVIWYTHG